MGKIPQEAECFIREHGGAVALLLYLADFNMPDDTGIRNKRRNEVAKWVLRAGGCETLAWQTAFAATETEQRQARNKTKKMLDEIKEARANLEDDDVIAWKEEKLAEYGRRNSELSAVVKKRKSLLQALRERFESLPLPGSDVFMEQVAALDEPPEFLRDLLAAGGSVLVRGIPDTHNGKPFRLSPAEIELLHEMGRRWGIQ